MSSSAACWIVQLLIVQSGHRIDTVGWKMGGALAHLLVKSEIDRARAGGLLVLINRDLQGKQCSKICQQTARSANQEKLTQGLVLISCARVSATVSIGSS